MELDVLGVIKKLDIRYKTVLISTFIIGIISQGMGVFNKFSVNDDAIWQYGVGATYTSGRWMLDILANLEKGFYGDGHYSLPAFNGFLAIFLIAISACLVVNILDIKNTFLCIFIAGIMVSFPVVTSIFGYMFTLHFYMISLLVGILGAFFVCRTEKWYLWIFGIILMGASVGIYQAFIPVTLSIFLLYLLDYTVKNNDLKLLVKKTVLVGTSCILFMGFYFAVNHCYLKLQGAVLSAYKGIDTMGKKSFSEYHYRMIDAYKEFFRPNNEKSYYMYQGNIIYLYKFILILLIVLSIAWAYRLLKRNVVNAVFFILLIVLMPLCINFIFVMVGKEEVHSLMVYAQLLPFVIFAWFIENNPIENKNIRKGMSAITILLALSLVVMYCRVDNRCYLKATYAQQEAISYFTTLVTQIKGTDGYKDELPVVFVNEQKISDMSLQFGDNGQMADICVYPYEIDAIGYVNNYAWMSFMK